MIDVVLHVHINLDDIRRGSVGYSINPTTAWMMILKMPDYVAEHNLKITAIYLVDSSSHNLPPSPDSYARYVNTRLANIF